MKQNKDGTNKWQSIGSWFLFSSFSSFAIGGLFLLFFMVPFEQWFFNEGLSQQGIDVVMNGLIGVYALLMVGLSFLYYLLLIKPRRKKLTYSFLSLSFIMAVYVFYVFLSPTSVAIKQLQGEVEEVDRFVFGPYPDEEKLQQLKEEGFAGVITLLSPAIPFEKVLLDKELTNGQAVGIPVNSYPMLPWVSDNKKALNGIKTLIEDTQGKYYVHCYLGKHRVDLARTSIFEAMGKELTKTYIFPDNIERGPITTFNENRIVLGPFPTDKEWFHLVLRPGIKEIISTLDPANPENVDWIDKARKVAQDHDMTFTEIPVKDGADRDNLLKLHNYVANADHSIYAFDFRGGKVMRALGTLLQGKKPFDDEQVPDKFERGEIIKIDRWLAIGPYPTPGEFDRLKDAGFTQFISLLNEEKEADVKWMEEEKAWANANGMTYQQFSLHEDNVDAKQLYEILRYLKNEATGPVYIHGFNTGKRAQLIAQLAQSYFYGTNDENVGEEILSNENINGGFYVQRDLAVGPVPSEKGWNDHLAFAGIRHIIVLPVAGFTNEQQIQAIKLVTENIPISYYSVQLSETYLDDIKEYLQNKEGLVYVMTATELAEGLAQKLKEEVLY